MLNKINILHVFSHYFNYSAIAFIKLKSNNKATKPKILCIHIIFNKKIEDLIKIYLQEKKFDNKKKRDLNLAFLTLFVF